MPEDFRTYVTIAQIIMMLLSGLVVYFYNEVKQVGHANAKELIELRLHVISNYATKDALTNALARIDANMAEWRVEQKATSEKLEGKLDRLIERGL